MAAFVEFFHGNAMVLVCCSANLDWRIRPELSVRVGAGAGLITDHNVAVVSTFVMVNRLIGRNGKYLELGAGIVRSNVAEVAAPTSRVGPTVAVGFRKQIDGRIVRVTFTPLLPPFAGRWESGRHFVPALGISYGVSF